MALIAHAVGAVSATRMLCVSQTVSACMGSALKTYTGPLPLLADDGWDVWRDFSATFRVPPRLRLREHSVDIVVSGKGRVPRQWIGQILARWLPGRANSGRSGRTVPPFTLAPKCVRVRREYDGDLRGLWGESQQMH